MRAAKSLFRQAGSAHQFIGRENLLEDLIRLTSGPEVVATLLCDGCHWISNGWFTRLRVYALRPVSMVRKD
jgi:hypothetical protein